MSIVSEFKLPLAEDESGQVIAYSVSNTVTHPIVAVAVKCKVIFFSDSGQKMSFVMQKNIPPTCIAWHPVQPIVAIGWNDGHMTIANVSLEKSKDEIGPYEGPVLKVLFNESGGRMASIYDEGTISIWKDLNCLNVFSKEKKITCSCAADIIVEKKNKTSKNMSLFFIGSENGTVWYANESKCDELCKLSSGVISIMFYQQNQSLVLITENFDMRLARITSNMTAPEKKVRLSLTVDSRFVKICWMDPCSFGITSWDNIVRIWNLKDDSNYSLNLSDLNRDSGGGVTFVMGRI